MFTFEAGKRYYDTWACDSDSVSIIEITKRTAKSVWFRYDYKRDSEPRRTKIFTDERGEYIIPERYSMACVYRAEREYTPEPEPTMEEIEAEQEKQRQAVQRKIEDGRAYINSISEQYPIKGGEPVVTIRWSEHPAFYSWEDDELQISVAAAEIVLNHYDAERHAENVAEDKGGYFKTKFLIEYTDPETGESSTYSGRYDLGDNDGGLIEHIRAFGEWHRTHTQFGQPVTNPPETNDTIRFAEWLSGYTAAGRVVSVKLAPWIVDFATKKREIEQRQKEQAEKEAREIFDCLEMLTDSQIEAAIMAIDPNDKEKIDIARFFLQEAIRRDKENAMSIYRRWKSGIA